MRVGRVEIKKGKKKRSGCEGLELDGREVGGERGWGMGKKERGEEGGNTFSFFTHK